MAKQLKLIRVVIRGEGIPDDTATIGGVEFKREGSGPPAIYLTYLKPRWWNGVRYPARADDEMKITSMTLPFSRSVGTEFCGSKVNQMIQAAGAQQTVAGAVGQIKPLLTYYQENFSVA
jgi:hypothetical protein